MRDFGGIGREFFCAKDLRSLLPKDFSEAVTLPWDPGGECGGDDDGSDAEGPCRLVGEETLWPGWQYSQIYWFDIRACYIVNNEGSIIARY